MFGNGGLSINDLNLFYYFKKIDTVFKMIQNKNIHILSMIYKNDLFELNKICLI